MQNFFTLLAFLVFTAVGFSQTISIKGKVTMPDDYPLESATVYLTSVKDSSVVNYTISDKNGNWEIKTRKTTQPVILKISYIGFADFKQELGTPEQNIDLGTLKLEDLPTELSEVVITRDIPPIRIKKDTLEFNASSFKVRPDANVESLLKQLPGVEIDNEGKITVNGKEVNQILVNGKPFFDKDGKIALENLPAELIEKVQVTDTKSKEEELSGEKASGNNSSINLTIDEKKNKGLFGKLMGGYGTGERYESSGLFNYFKGSRKISVLASSNNINSTGFSMNEIFDNMSGGRNRSVSTRSDGSFNINGVQFGGGKGITRSNIIGVNYADELVKGYDSNLGYFYTSQNSENNNRTRQTTFLPGDANTGTGLNRSFTTESSARSNSDAYTHNITSAFTFKTDTLTTIYFEPKLSINNSKFSNRSSQSSVNENNVLLNTSDADRFDETDTQTFSNILEYYRKLKKKGRSVSFGVDNNNSTNDIANFNNSVTTSYFNPEGLPEITNDIRNQVRYNKKIDDRYGVRLNYVEPVSDSLRIKTELLYRNRKSVENRRGFDFDQFTGRYTMANELLTNYLSSTTNTITPNMSIFLEKKKLNISLSGGAAFTQFDNFSNYLNQETRLNKDYILPTAEAYASYSFTTSKYLWANYSYGVEFPLPQQVLPVQDLSDPIFTYVGNPDLDPTKSHNVYFGFGDYDYNTQAGYYIYAGGYLYDRQVVSSTIFDESARRITTYENVSGTYYSWVGGSWNKSIKQEAHKFKVSLDVNANFNYFKGFVNGQMYDARETALNPGLFLTWDYGELLSVTPSYSFTTEKTNYTNFTVNSASNFIHRAGLQTTSYWPKHFVFGNDFNYIYNSQIADGFRKDYLLWNTSLGYNFLNDKLLFKVKVYDLLNQNLNATRTISPTSITDEQNTVLKRYAMFSLTFKFDKFGTKTKEEKGEN